MRKLVSLVLDKYCSDIIFMIWSVPDEGQLRLSQFSGQVLILHKKLNILSSWSSLQLTFVGQFLFAGRYNKRSFKIFSVSRKLAVTVSLFCFFLNFWDEILLYIICETSLVFCLLFCSFAVCVYYVHINRVVVSEPSTAETQYFWFCLRVN